MRGCVGCIMRARGHAGVAGEGIRAEVAPFGIICVFGPATWTPHNITPEMELPSFLGFIFVLMGYSLDIEAVCCCRYNYGESEPRLTRPGDARPYNRSRVGGRARDAVIYVYREAKSLGLRGSGVVYMRRGTPSWCTSFRVEGIPYAPFLPQVRSLRIPA